MNDAENEREQHGMVSREVARWSSAFGVPAVAVQFRRPMVLVRPNRERTGFTAVDPKTKERTRVLHPEPTLADGGLVATDILTPCTLSPDPTGLSLIVQFPVLDANGKLDYRSTLVVNPDDLLAVTVIAAPDDSRIVMPSA